MYLQAQCREATQAETVTKEAADQVIKTLELSLQKMEDQMRNVKMFKQVLGVRFALQGSDQTALIHTLTSSGQQGASFDLQDRIDEMQISSRTFIA